MAKYAGLIPWVKPALDRMKDNEEGISKSVYFQTLQDAGE